MIEPPGLRASATWRSPATGAIDGLLLAGGRSRRFGSDKRRALFGGRTLARRALELLREATGGRVLVAGCAAFDRPVTATLVEDAAKDAGPLGGIVGGLRRSRAGVLVLACDVPLVRADTLTAIVALAHRRGRTVVVRSPRGLEPLVAFYPRSALPLLAAGLREGNRALHRLVPRLRPLVVEAADAIELHNVNRPEDLELAARATAARKR